MTPRPKIDMAEATRLTRAGRLHEAMAVLQGRPADAPPAPAPTAADAGGTGPLLDMVAPGSPGGAWTAPKARAPLGAVLRGLKARRTAAAPAVSVPAGASFESRRHEGATGALDYRLYVPAGRTGPLPLIVMLHGCTQSPEDFAAGTGMNAVAEELGFLVAWPEQTRAANANLCWNWFEPGDQRRGAGEPALVAGIVRDVLASEAADGSRVFVAGLSAGGAAAAVMAAAYPDLVAGIGVHSGLAAGAAHDLPSALAAMRMGGAGAAGRGVPAVVLHGDRDATVAPANGDAVAAQARGATRLRARTERGRSDGGLEFTRTVHEDAAGLARLEQWVLHGAGHAWSGGHPAGSHVEPRGPDASRAMARFFLALPPR